MSQPQNNLNIKTTDDDGISIVGLTGELDLGTSPDLHAELIRLIETKPRRIILDMRELAYIDSSGVGTLVDAHRRLKKEGGNVVLVGLQQRVRSVFEITRLDSFFTITANLDEARTA